MRRIATTSVMFTLVGALLGPGCAAPAPVERDDPPPRLGADEFDDAADQLVRKLRERAAAGGWPDHVPLSGEPPRPRVWLSSKNRAQEQVDLAAFEARVAAALTAAGVADPTAGPEDEGALALQASIADEVTDLPDGRRTDYTFHFLLTDPTQGAVLASSRTRIARIQTKAKQQE